jgi:branched-chain amino acid transport system substrate-binding protein
MKKFKAFINKYMPSADLADSNVVYGYACAQTLVEVLEQAGEDLTRENVMRQATNLKGFAPDTLLPGIKISTSSVDYAPIKQLQMMKFHQGKWEPLGGVLGDEGGG